jgi:hypothetical protein
VAQTAWPIIVATVDSAALVAGLMWMGSGMGIRALGSFHRGTGGWLMYLTWATVLSFAAGSHLTL